MSLFIFMRLPNREGIAKYLFSVAKQPTVEQTKTTASEGVEKTQRDGEKTRQKERDRLRVRASCLFNYAIDSFADPDAPEC